MQTNKLVFEDKIYGQKADLKIRDAYLEIDGKYKGILSMDCKTGEILSLGGRIIFSPRNLLG